MKRFGLLIVLVLAVGSSVEATRRRHEPPVQIRAIETESKNVFDPAVPGEDWWIFRMANAIHIRTRESVIRGLLLVRPGERVPRERLEESERFLRSLNFIKSAEIVPVPTPDGPVDLRVKTQDSWTLQPQVNFSREGGETKFSTGFLEENFLGFGKSVSYFYKKDADGVAHEFEYQDPLLWGTRFQLLTHLETFPTGNQQILNLARPFFSLSTRVAGGVSTARDNRLQRIFQSGQEINRYQRESFSAEPFGGFRLGGGPDHAQRMTFRYHYSEEIFRAHAQTNLARMPANRTLSGPLANWTFDESRFIKETWVDRAERVEDYNLGQRLSMAGGYYGRGMGSSENSIPFGASHAFGFGGDGAWFGTASWGGSGRYYLRYFDQPRGKPVNTVYFANFNYYRHALTEWPVTGVLHMEGAYLQNGDTQNPLELGGDTGLRGYKNTAFSGNKSALLNLEIRTFYPRELLHLFYWGAAAFLDAGQTQPIGQPMRSNAIQANLGVGFRMGLSRAAEGTVVRIDMAWAVRNYPGEDRWVLSITTGQGFKSSGNTYAKAASAPGL